MDVRLILNVFILVLGPHFSVQRERWTLHTTEENWNDANLVCRRSGGTLVYPRSASQWNAFKRFLRTSHWADKINGTTLVGVLWRQDKNALVWMGCKEETTDPPRLEGFCGAWDAERDEAAAVSCFTERRTFICQASRSSGGGNGCSFVEYQGKIPTNGSGDEGLSRSAYQLTNRRTERGCRALCGRTERCWAYSITEDTCWLYHLDDPLYFYQGENLISNASSVTYVKVCFQVYALHLPPLSWYQAKRRCESAGYSLAEFDLETKRHIVPQLMLTKSSQPFWSGFRLQDWALYPDQINWLTSRVQVYPLPENRTGVSGDSTPACGSTQMPEMTNQLRPCTHQLPVVCQRRRRVQHCGITVTPDTLLTGNTLNVTLTNNSEVNAFKLVQILRSSAAAIRDVSSCFSCPSALGGTDCHVLNTTSWEDCFSGGVTAATVPPGWTAYRTSCYSVIELKRSFEETTSESPLVVNTTDFDVEVGTATESMRSRTKIRDVTTSQPRLGSRFDVSPITEDATTSLFTEDATTSLFTEDATPSPITEDATTSLFTEDAVTSSIEIAAISQVSTENVMRSSQVSVSPNNDVTSTGLVTYSHEQKTDTTTYPLSSAPAGVLESSGTPENNFRPNTELTTEGSSLDRVEELLSTSPTFDSGQSTQQQENNDTQPSTSYIVANDQTTAATDTIVHHESKSRTRVAKFLLCPCPCSNITVNYSNTFSEFLQVLQTFANDTSLSKRRKESADDWRPSSVCLGMVACVAMVTVLGALIASDAYHLVILFL